MLKANLRTLQDNHVRDSLSATQLLGNASDRPVIPSAREAKGEGDKDEGLLGLQNEFQTSLGNLVRCCLKTKHRKKVGM